LVLDQVEVGYAGSTFQMTDISFEAGPGDVVALIGPNGSGKSTLLKAIAGVLPLQHGRITLAGRAIETHLGRLAFVPQREDVNWDFPATALDVVLMARNRDIGWFRRPDRHDREVAQESLTRMGLGGMGSRHISEFSGGQQQRIFLARALAQEPEIVLLDEPFTGIDVENREILHGVMRSLAAQGVVTLVATHDLDEVGETSSLLACINRGLVAFGPTSTTFTPENLRATFGGELAVFA
jgi:ABC-type Mn2+/Zn2+ transport system ATPase subunit